jgi:hypothetical protein
MRELYMVLSPKALPYAQLALQTLFRNCAEPFHLRLITDSPEDKRTLHDAVAPLAAQTGHLWGVFDENDLADREAERFGAWPAIRAFRHGHPCWRKITDPLLLSNPGEELVLLDPDLCFPNRFRFEETPAQGILLMWQQPNCLLPSEVVLAAMSHSIPLANHVDIGVAHWRGPGDLDWLNGLLETLGGGAALPRVMHVEAIVWSALLMQWGGGHLDPRYWRCWRNSQMKRIRRKLGASGAQILASEPWGELKCFHAGGEAKWWLSAASSPTGGEYKDSGPARVIPAVELKPADYERELAMKEWIRRLGYYRLFR